MADWLESLDEDERRSWNEFVDHFRRDALAKIDDSAFVASIVPDVEFDVKFAMELGAALMLDKPILAIVGPSANLTFRLERAADVVVRADIDTEEGQKAVRDAISGMLGAERREE